MSERRRRGIGLSRRRRLSLAACASGLTLLGVSAAGLTLDGPTSPARAEDPPGTILLDASVAYLQRMQFPDGCYPQREGGPGDPETATPWTALALAAAGVNPREQFRPGGTASAFDCIERAAGKLRVTTDLERTLLVVNAAGADPHDFGGIDLVARILATERNGAFDREPSDPQLSSPVNTTIFAILALAPVAEPAAQAAVQRAADWVLHAQKTNGSWAAVTADGPADADMTGAALEALRAAGTLDGAGNGEPAARDAVRRALAWFRTVQRADGGFATGPDTIGNSGSTAWVAQGLWAVGEDPGRWIGSDGRSMLSFLASLQQPDGRIVWKAGSDLNPVWMTSYTLPAYSGRYLPFTAVPDGGRRPDPNAPPAPLPEQPTPGVGGGSGGGGAGDTSGGGVLAGGGGDGAPNFSRPRPGSRGRTVGGARRTRRDRASGRVDRTRSQAAQERDPSEAAAIVPISRRRDRDAPANAATRTGSANADGGRRDALGTRGLGRGTGTPPAGTGDDGEQIDGVVIGDENAAGDDQGDTNVASAFGLRSASAGGDSGPWIAVALAGAMLLAAGGGGLAERRR